MKFDDLKEGTKVVDTWFWNYGVGAVTKKLKTVVYIMFTHAGLIKYDRPHATQFLKEHKHAKNKKAHV